MKIYTKNGDYGDTRLCNGQIVSKDSPRVDAYGDVDELNAFIGLYITKIEDSKIIKIVKKVQSDLFIIGSMLSSPTAISQIHLDAQNENQLPYIREEDVEYLEKRIDEFEEELTPLKHFIIPGGRETSAILHVARTICRRAERKVVRLKRNEEISKEITRYLNRLSDFLFVLSRVENKRAGIKDCEWNR